MATKPLFNPQSSKKEEDEQPTSSDEQMEEQDSEEEENSSGDEEDASEEEEDQEKVIPSPQKLLSKTQPHKSESESEGESDESPSAYKLQPILKPSVNKEKRTHVEISNGQPSSKGSKKAKVDEKSGPNLSSTPVGGHITRLWGDDDEVSLLNGLIESKNLRNGDIAGAAYDKIRGKLKADVSKDQFRTKVGRLKKRFLNALKKGRDGMDPVFSKPHDVKVFELSKEVWGVTDGERKGSKVDVSAVVHKTSSKKVENIRQDQEDLKNQKDDEGAKFSSSFPFLVSSFNDTVGKFPSLELSDGALKVVKDKLCLIENTKANDLNEKWRKLLLEEVELQYKRLTLMKEQIILVLDQ